MLHSRYQALVWTRNIKFYHSRTEIKMSPEKDSSNWLNSPLYYQKGSIIIFYKRNCNEYIMYLTNFNLNHYHM